MKTSQSSSSVPWGAHCLWLAGPILVFGLSFLLKPGTGREVIVPLVERPLPDTCAMFTTLGVNCPGCGLTRSFLHISRGDVEAAWRLNPVGILLYSYLAIQIPLAIFHWITTSQKKASSTISRWMGFNERAIVVIAILLVIQWLVRIGS